MVRVFNFTVVEIRSEPYKRVCLRQNM
jgi:hypothetical protein